MDVLTPNMTTPAPRRNSKILQRVNSANTYSANKKKSTSINKRSGTLSIDNVRTVNNEVESVVGDQPIDPASIPGPLQDQRNLEEKLVELDHLRTLNIEVDRERGVTQKVQSDVEMLRKQLARANEQNKGNEQVRKEQAETITMLEKTRTEQAEHITKLEQVRDQQKSHIDLLE